MYTFYRAPLDFSDIEKISRFCSFELAWSLTKMTSRFERANDQPLFDTNYLMQKSDKTGSSIMYLYLRSLLQSWVIMTTASWYTDLCPWMFRRC
jgi:hypothetical protein